MATITTVKPNRINQTANAIIQSVIENGGDVYELKNNAETYACKYGADALRFRGINNNRYSTAQDRALVWLTVVDLIETHHE